MTKLVITGEQLLALTNLVSEYMIVHPEASDAQLRAQFDEIPAAPMDDILRICHNALDGMRENSPHMMEVIRAGLVGDLDSVSDEVMVAAEAEDAKLTDELDQLRAEAAEAAEAAAAAATARPTLTVTMEQAKVIAQEAAGPNAHVLGFQAEQVPGGYGEIMEHYEIHLPGHDGVVVTARSMDEFVAFLTDIIEQTGGAWVGGSSIVGQDPNTGEAVLERTERYPRGRQGGYPMPASWDARRARKGAQGGQHD